jgi:hypothetical protein
MTFDDKGMPSFVNAPSSLGLGQYGTTGMFARTAQEAAGQEAEARLATRVSGIRGGLARQREVMAETLGAQRMGEVSSDLMSSILGAYSGVTSDYRTELDKAIAAESEGAGAMAKTTPVTIPVTTPITTPVQETPTAPTTTQQPWWTQLKPGEDGGNQTVPSASRGAYDTIGDPGPKAPKTKTAGAAYKGPGGVLWVYRTNGPKGQGWYKKSKGGD